MSLFRKRYTPQELGALLYEELRSSMTSDGLLSVTRLVRSLDRDEAALDQQYLGEIMVGAMFGATLAVERSSSGWVAEQISQGMRGEFASHLREQGASETQIQEWQVVLDARFGEYRACLRGYEGLEPPWKMGRVFYWNLSGTQDYMAMNVKICTLYMVAARDYVQPLINEEGPRLLISFVS